MSESISPRERAYCCTTKVCHPERSRASGVVEGPAFLAHHHDRARKYNGRPSLSGRLETRNCLYAFTPSICIRSICFSNGLEYFFSIFSRNVGPELYAQNGYSRPFGAA
jgi:hypothetical protein